MDGDLIIGSDGVRRCAWAGRDPLYVHYHDHEWGRPLRGDAALFEMLSLEGFQAGLAWITILNKRDAFRQAFAGFDIESVAQFEGPDVERLMADPGIVRNRAKIDATIGNALAVLALAKEGVSFTELLWSARPASRPRPSTAADVPAQTPASRALSGELKRRGFRFVGPTVLYAFMQAVGMVDDHLRECAISVGEIDR